MTKILVPGTTSTILPAGRMILLPPNVNFVRPLLGIEAMQLMGCRKVRDLYMSLMMLCCYYGPSRRKLDQILPQVEDFSKAITSGR